MAPKLISTILWTLVSINLIALVLGGLVTWLGYAIPIRLRQFGLSPELTQVAGFGSLLIACLGLCALNYSSHYALNAYGLSCAIFIVFMLFGIIPDEWQQSINQQQRSTLQQQLLHANYTSTLTSSRNSTITTTNGSELTQANHHSRVTSNGLVIDIIYFVLLFLLLLLLLFAFILAQYFRRHQEHKLLRHRANSTHTNCTCTSEFQINGSDHSAALATIAGNQQAAHVINSQMNRQRTRFDDHDYYEYNGDQDQMIHSQPAPLVHRGFYQSMRNAQLHTGTNSDQNEHCLNKRLTSHQLDSWHKQRWPHAPISVRRLVDLDSARCRCDSDLAAKLNLDSNKHHQPVPYQYRVQHNNKLRAHYNTMPSKFNVMMNASYAPTRINPANGNGSMFGAAKRGRRSKPSGGSVMAMTAAAAAALLGGVADSSLLESAAPGGGGSVFESTLDDGVLQDADMDLDLVDQTALDGNEFILNHDHQMARPTSFDEQQQQQQFQHEGDDNFVYGPTTQLDGPVVDFDPMLSFERQP